MAKLTLKKAATDVTVYLFAQDSSKTTGVGLAGLAYNTASLTAYYVRPLGSAAAITLATQTVTGAHSDGGFVEVDATNMPGVYRLDLPDAVCATGVPSAIVMLKGAANMAPVLLEVQLLTNDPNDIATQTTSAAILEDTGTTLDDLVDGLETMLTDIHDTDLPAVKSDTAAILTDTGTDGVKIASGELSTVATAASITALDGKIDTIDNFLDTEIADILADTNELQAELADGGRTDLLIDAIKAKTDTIAAAPTAASVADAVWDEAIADHTSVGSFGAKNQKVVPSETINDYKADVSALATAAALDAVDNFIDTEITTIDGIVDAIKLKTDLIPAAPAEAGEYTAAIAAIPTAPLLASGYTAPDNAGIAAIKAKTDQMVFTTPNKIDATATVDTSGLATSTALATIDGNVDAIKVKTDQMAFTVPNKIDASATVDPTGIATSEELEIIGDKVDDVLDKLNVSSVEFVTAVIGSTITILRGDTLSAALLNLGSLASYVSLDFTIKRSAYEADDDAIVRIRKNATGLTDGLVRLNGAAYTTGTDGSITITDAPTGDITIMLKAAVTDDLVPGSYVYDIQLIEAAEVSTLTTGGLVVTADVTRLVA